MAAPAARRRMQDAAPRVRAVCCVAGLGGGGRSSALRHAALPDSAEPGRVEVFETVDRPALLLRIKQDLTACDYSRAVQTIWDVLNAASRYIEQKRPFELAKTDKPACKTVLVDLVEALRTAAILIKPIMPGTSRKVWDSFNFAQDHATVRYEDACRGVFTRGDVRVTAPMGPDGKVQPMFPRIKG